MLFFCDYPGCNKAPVYLVQEEYICEAFGVKYTAFKNCCEEHQKWASEEVHRLAEMRKGFYNPGGKETAWKS